MNKFTKVLGLASDNYFNLLSDAGELHQHLRLDPATCRCERDVIIQWWNECQNEDDLILVVFLAMYI